MTAPRAKTRVLVWDLPTRLFHWLLVLLLLTSYLTVEVFSTADLRWHKLAGYAVLTLLLFRLCWGFAGGRHSRFAAFLRGPWAVLRYAATLGRRDTPPHAGHNPLGALSVVALLLSLAVQAITGLFSDNEILAEGPLAPLVDSATRQWFMTLHYANFNVLLALVILHLAAIVFYAVWKRQDLVAPMVTGQARRLPPAAAGSSPPLWRALLLLALSVAVVTLVVAGLPEWLPPAAGGGGGTGGGKSWD